MKTTCSVTVRFASESDAAQWAVRLQELGLIAPQAGVRHADLLDTGLGGRVSPGQFLVADAPGCSADWLVAPLNG